MDNTQKIREMYIQETGACDVFAYRQEYAGARMQQDGYSDNYVEWLEAKTSALVEAGKQLGDLLVKQQERQFQKMAKRYQEILRMSPGEGYTIPADPRYCQCGYRHTLDVAICSKCGKDFEPGRIM